MIKQYHEESFVHWRLHKRYKGSGIMESLLMVCGLFAICSLLGERISDIVETGTLGWDTLRIVVYLVVFFYCNYYLLQSILKSVYNFGVLMSVLMRTLTAPSYHGGPDTKELTVCVDDCVRGKKIYLVIDCGTGISRYRLITIDAYMLCDEAYLYLLKHVQGPLIKLYRSAAKANNYGYVAQECSLRLLADEISSVIRGHSELDLDLQGCLSAIEDKISRLSSQLNVTACVDD